MSVAIPLKTINDKRIIGVDILSKLYTWSNALFGVHLNLKGHTNGGMQFVYWVVHCKSRKQKLNTKSLTEARLVGLSDYLPYIIWIVLFMGAQGYDIQQNILL